jgi:phosphopantothenoylcysteine synthetase/decarboxylase
MPVAVIVTCGAPLAERLGDLVDAMQAHGWESHVVGTPASAAWIDTALVDQLGVRFDFRVPDGLKTAPEPDVVAVCPATFNTVNKVALGIADNYATSFVCEAIGAGSPVLMVPMVNQKLWSHLRWTSSLEDLRRANVRFLDVQSGEAEARPVESGTGDFVVRGFQPGWLISALEEIVSPR